MLWFKNKRLTSESRSPSSDPTAMTSTRILLLFLVPALAGGTQTSIYGTARDYLSVTSENYPASYPGPDSWTWRWSVDSGLWAVLFLDFQMPCGDNHQDALVISDPRRNLTFSCGNQPPKDYPYIIESPWFSMHLHSGSTQPHTDQQTHRRFKCQVLYANTRGALQSKIDDLRTRGRTRVSSKDDDSGSLKPDTIVIILLLIIVPLVVIVVIVVAVLLVRRRQQQPSASLHLNIGSIRRNSSVSYTRHGSGPPAGARGRLDSDSSTLSQDFPAMGRTARRATKRSESNSSWAMRAEMNTALRTGSCSSEGHLNSTTIPNFYSPCPPGELGPFLEPEKNHAKMSPKKGGKCPEKSHTKTGRPQKVGKGSEDRSPLSEVCRLSTICEESCGMAAKLSASFPVPSMPQSDGIEESSLAIANAGYMLMTSCAANYVNCGQS